MVIIDIVEINCGRAFCAGYFEIERHRQIGVLDTVPKTCNSLGEHNKHRLDIKLFKKNATRKRSSFGKNCLFA